MRLVESVKLLDGLLELRLRHTVAETIATLLPEALNITWEPLTRADSGVKAELVRRLILQGPWGMYDSMTGKHISKQIAWEQKQYIYF